MCNHVEEAEVPPNALLLGVLFNRLPLGYSLDMIMSTYHLYSYNTVSVDSRIYHMMKLIVRWCWKVHYSIATIPHQICYKAPFCYGSHITSQRSGMIRNHSTNNQYRSRDK